MAKSIPSNKKVSDDRDKKTGNESPEYESAPMLDMDASRFKPSDLTYYLPQGIRIINIDYTVCYTNPSFAKLAGANSEEAIGKKCFEVFLSPFCHTPQCSLARIIKGEMSVRAEIDRIRNDGSTIPCILSAFPLYTSDNKLIGIMESFLDINEKRQMQAQIEESENLYNTLFESTGTATCILNEKGIVTLANKQWKKILGYTEEDMNSPKHFTDFVHPDEVDRIKKYFELRKTSPSEIPEEYETRIIDKQGNIKHVLVTVRMIPGSGNRIVSTLDITERKRAEGKLIDSEKHYRNLFEQAPVAISERDYSETKRFLDELHEKGINDFKKYFLSNPDMVYICFKLSKLIGVNQELLNIHGPGVRETIISLAEDSIKNRTEFWWVFYDIITSLAKGQTWFSTQHKIVTVNGQYKHIHIIVSVAPGCEHDLSRVYTFFSDITELKESEAQCKALVDLSVEVGEGILVVQDINDEKGIITFASSQCARIMGYTIEEMLGKSWFDLISPEDRNASVERHRRKMKGESLPGLYDVSIVRKDGKQVPMELTSAVTQYLGKPANVVYLRDITERKIIENKLKKSEFRLRALSRKIISAQESERVHLSRELHDRIGQQLVSLRLGILNLADKCPAANHGYEIDKILSGVDKLIDISQDLASHLRPGMLDKLGLVATLQWYAENLEQQTGISCVVNAKNSFGEDIPPDIAIVAYRIVQEALTNVIRHSQASRTEIKLENRKNMLVISVKDNGVGRSHGKGLNKLQLGLMGMQERASIIGGTFKTINHPGKGFTVRVSLPFHIEATHSN